MSLLHVSLFGRFQARNDQQEVAGLAAHKVQELLTYLLLYRDYPHPREVLADMLWSDSSPSQSKRYLRKTLWQLQAALDSQIPLRNGRALLVDPGWIQLNPGAELWLDVAEFEQVFEKVKGVPGTQLGSRRAGSLQSAVDLYQGDLLEGWYQDWCLYERERLQHMYLIMLDKLMSHCESHGKWEAGLAHGALVLRYDRAHERTHRRLMRLHYLAGDRTSALRQYQRCLTALDQELGVKPSRRTAVLYEQLCADKLDEIALAPLESSDVASLTLLSVLGRLRYFQRLLVVAQTQVEQDIQAVESALNRKS
jgi:DNA-binding SARP family transcriptional activator